MDRSATEKKNTQLDLKLSQRITDYILLTYFLKTQAKIITSNFSGFNTSAVTAVPTPYSALHFVKMNLTKL